jgi:hypothetical protein
MKAYEQTSADRGERGQVLVMFAFGIIIFLLFVMMVVDVGFVALEKRNTQNALDAAALAGAQELPDDPVLAEQLARDYAQKNGLDPDELTISFSCTSTLTRVCNVSEGKYDTITLEATSQAPVFFGRVLSLVGDPGCWASGCNVSALAAACSGACGASAQNVDVVTVIDHTGSMTVTDLQNAKDGANRLYEVFDRQVHDVALAVTPPVHTTDHCDTVDRWTDPQTWLPVGLNADYQDSTGLLNPFSALVSTTNCLDRATGSGDVPGPHTNLGEPMKAAMNELLNNGRSNATSGIVFFTDGAANIADATAMAAVGATGPCDYAVKMASAAKAQGIEIYTIAYGADDDCDRDTPGTAWYNKTAVELLEAMATDSEHFYNAPRTADLDPIFEEIGIQLGGSTRLIR